MCSLPMYISWLNEQSHLALRKGSIYTHFCQAAQSCWVPADIKIAFNFALKWGGKINSPEHVYEIQPHSHQHLSLNELQSTVSSDKRDEAVEKAE